MNEKRINRLLIYGIVGILYSFYLIIDCILNDMSIPIIVIACFLFLFSVFFIISHIKLKNIKSKSKKSSIK